MYYPSIFHNVDKVFDSAFNQASSWSPVVDVINKGNSVDVSVELPGVQKEHVSVNVENGVLGISAKKEAPENVKGKDYYINERHYGEYKRSFKLSEDLDAENVSASFENGVLTLSIARKEAAVARKIEIQ
jgi:HSP20 family protein